MLQHAKSQSTDSRCGRLLEPSKRSAHRAGGLSVRSGQTVAPILLEKHVEQVSPIGRKWRSNRWSGRCTQCKLPLDEALHGIRKSLGSPPERN